ncbi:sugar transferase [Parasporobacterium paucivorans]|uniref:Exopolysaccharide biosynthesis polyprenyl glycosylphosphotransferase n=1 Tax=Parasporobacterium paucivorans DSM 15970 TaxID=1122934 RepID=A0A1M6E8X7_9FIRM|nr:sugar transferase [Parasporobacterium paucivorans]SHI81891.1 exopolysaccharide biosynthesis polyprenyl glycosylphosphotransferase [Parasporobacterium paucivorans DSM 15970]
MYKRIGSSWVKHLDFIILDLVCLQISFQLAYLLRYGVIQPYGNPFYMRMAFLLIFFHFIITFFSEMYSGILKRGCLSEFKKVIHYNAILLGCIFGYIFIMQISSAYSRIVFILFGVIDCFMMYGVRLYLKRILRAKTKDKKNQQQLLLLSNKAQAEDCIEKLQANKYSTLNLKGLIVFDEDMAGQHISGVPVLANLDTMMEFIRTHVVDEVLLNLESPKVAGEITRRCLQMGIAVHLHIGHIAAELPNAEVQKINDLTVITTSINTVTSRQLALKRIISLLGGAAGLLGMGIAFVIFAPPIYMQSPGPIFFSQTRVGRNGRPFRMYKFRSMYMDAEERKKDLMEHNKMQGHMFKMDNDPRITPIGRFLRATSLDELPQSINILLGDMELVGTRPPTMDEYKKYELHHKSRLAARPGLTGMWQVSGRSDITDFEEVVRLDNEYIENWTLSLDIKILWKTVLVVLRRRGSG